MSMLDKLRAEAATLEAEARASGYSIKHSAALEEVAKRHGYDGWRACVAIFSDAALTDCTSNSLEMKPFRSSEWGFSLDIPARWNSFPAVLTNSPWEVIRFASHENGFHNLIVFHEPYDPKQSPEEHSKVIQDVLEKQGFSNFVRRTTKIRSKPTVTLDFDKSFEGSVWSCRHYFMIDGSTLAYVLGCGSTKWSEVNDLFDGVAQSFTIE